LLDLDVKTLGLKYGCGKWYCYVGQIFGGLSDNVIPLEL